MTFVLIYTAPRQTKIIDIAVYRYGTLYLECNKIRLVNVLFLSMLFYFLISGRTGKNIAFRFIRYVSKHNKKIK